MNFKLPEWVTDLNRPAQGQFFPAWVDQFLKVAIVCVALTGGYVTMLVAYGAGPKTTDVGYAPEQPIPYSHALHAGELGIDCRYCHTGVEKAAHANIPPSSTCWNCHSRILTESPKLEPLRESMATGNSIPWVRIHDLPDYSYFNHSAHVTRGVGCVSCHGRIDTMEVVYQHEPLSMSWCVDCHRHPEKSLRPPELATDMIWHLQPEDSRTWPDGRPFNVEEYVAAAGINPPTDCSTCHR